MINYCKYSVSIIFIFSTSFCNCQNQGNNWFFGNSAGITFNGGNPTYLDSGMTYSSMIPAEGTTSISDNNGNLLFYSNGEKISNRKHQLMPNGNGLLSNLSSTQGPLIVPKPGSNNLFYLFTVDDFFVNDLQYGFRYNIIDMCLDSGRGDVIANQKNIKLLDTVCEKLAATNHSNGTDYWILVHKYYSTCFYAYLLTANGISDTVISCLGTFHNGGGTGGAIGQMKISPNGQKVALASGNSNNHLDLYDFNPSTGIVSNHLELPLRFPGSNGYGAAFSPDNSKVYFGVLSITPSESYIAQFDLNAGGGNSDSIQNSEYLVWHSPATMVQNMGLQLGPDGKIYRPNGSYLSAICYPNLNGSAVTYISQILGLNTGVATLTLPSFIDSYNYHNTTIPDCAIINEIDEFTSPEFRISFFPNPANDYFIIQLDKIIEKATIKINDLSGREIYHQELNESDSYFINTGNLTTGVYFLQIYSANRLIKTDKLIIGN